MRVKLALTASRTIGADPTELECRLLLLGFFILGSVVKRIALKRSLASLSRA